MGLPVAHIFDAWSLKWRRIGVALEAFLAGRMRTFEDNIASDTQVDPRIRRRFAALFAAGQLGMYYMIFPRCDWFMDAIASCYRAAIAPQSTLLVSATEAVACVVKFLEANQDRLLNVKDGGAITEGSYTKAVGLRPGRDRHGRRV
jgi:hypothetical protein